MATTMVRQFVATINSGKTFVWAMTNTNPPFNRPLRKDAKPKWIVEWQAIPLVVSVDLDSPNVATAKAGLQISPVTVVQEGDTSLTHIVPITCIDKGNPPGAPARFVVTYALYAVFFDVS